MKTADERIFKLAEEVRAELKRKEQLDLTPMSRAPTLSPGLPSRPLPNPYNKTRTEKEKTKTLSRDPTYKTIIVKPRESDTAIPHIEKAIEHENNIIERNTYTEVDPNISYISDKSLDISGDSLNKNQEVITRKPSNNHLAADKPIISTPTMKSSLSLPKVTLAPDSPRPNSLKIQENDSKRKASYSDFTIAVYDENEKLTRIEEGYKKVPIRTKKILLGTQSFYSEFPSKIPEINIGKLSEEINELTKFVNEVKEERKIQNNKFLTVTAQMQEMKIAMKQLAEENERLRKSEKAKMQPIEAKIETTKISVMPKEVKNEKTFSRKISPLVEYSSGEDFTARELLDPHNK